MSEKKQIFFGIDLGTTNSCIAFGTFDPVNKSVKPNILKISQRNTSMGMEQNNLLPSVICFEEENPVIDIYAKDKLQTQPSRVVFSVKNFMGQSQDIKVDNKSYSPQELSSLILKHIKKEVENRLNLPLNDVVIGVPASFDQDMRAATIESARLAGFSVTNEDGTPKNILVDEPRAALYDFIYKFKKGELFVPNFDPKEKKCVLVFDLGGGTLDVSLHEMKQKQGELHIDDLAISRYTQLGGDVFDRLLASYFLKLFVEHNKINFEELSELDQYEVEIKFFSAAEEVKKEITSDITNALIYDNKTLAELEDKVYDVTPGFILDSKYFFTSITKRQYDEIISDLLAWDLTIEDMGDFASLPIEKSHNIIYPILDVLSKAKKKNGKMPKVDFILLNGGMTRVHAVKQRLEEFFGIKPYAGLDPDLAVAIGACIHHYNLSQGVKLNPILAETVGLELRGGKVKHLVPAGTVLPYRGDWERYKISKEGINILRIPLYVGERADINPPNRKIVERHFRFNKRCSKDEPVYARINIDRNKTVTFEYYLNREPNKTYICEANVWDQAKSQVKGTAEIFVQEMEKTKTTIKASTPSIPYKVIIDESEGERISKREDTVREDIMDTRPQILEVKDTLNQFNETCQKKDTKKMANILVQVIQAKNYQEFILPLGAMLRETQPWFNLKWIIIFLGHLVEKEGDYRKYKNYVRRIALIISQIDKQRASFVKIVIKQAVIALGKMGASEHIDTILDASEYPNSLSITPDILITLGKIGSSKEIIDFANRVLRTPTPIEHKISAAWCIGKVGSRTRKNPIKAEFLSQSIDFLVENLKKYQNNMNAKTYFAYALGMVGNSSIKEKKISDKETIKINDALLIVLGKSYFEKQKNKNLVKLQRLDNKVASIALKLVGGEELLPEEKSLMDELEPIF